MDGWIKWLALYGRQAHFHFKSLEFGAPVRPSARSNSINGPLAGFRFSIVTVSTVGETRTCVVQNVTAREDAPSGCYGIQNGANGATAHPIQRGYDASLGSREAVLLGLCNPPECPTAQPPARWWPSALR